MAAAENGAEPGETRQAYRCFLVRCRLVAGEEPGWRFTVQQVGPHAGRRSFTSSRDVAIHLETELASCAACAPVEPADPARDEVHST